MFSRAGILRAGMWGVMWLAVFFVGVRSLDPDFGWHIQMGNLILAGGVPQTDPFSYTMANFPFIDHEWLTNTIIAVLYPRVGMAGLAVIFATIVLGTIWVAVPKSEWMWADLPVMLGFTVFLGRAGVRPQIMDWLFLAIVLRLLADDRLWKKWKWGLVGLELVWANLHGGFALGIAVVGCVLGVKWIWGKRWEWSDWGVWAGMWVVTVVNPYGLRLWDEVIMQMTDTNLRWKIAEWQPFWAGVELGYWLLAGMVLSLVMKYKKGTALWQKLVLVTTFVMGLSSLRHMPLFVVSALPVAAGGFAGFYREIKGNRLKIDRARKFYALLLGVVGLFTLAESGLYIWQAQQGNWGIIYPTEAVKFVRADGVEGEIFSFYGWGGYLIREMPERKVFIDGRMPSWRWAGYIGAEKSPETKYSDWAFREYLKVTEEGEFKGVFDKYGIHSVLWPSQLEEESTGWAKKMQEWWEKWRGKPKREDFIKGLKEAGWREAYRDKTAVIYEKL
ncbi:MAG: hypothetical protein UX91_C0001G0141 [Candidatus Amesbacteria bacterium GW2011_GWB1_47_19]|nr:MAG: hypothetical protein UW51_C0001G0141 [Candidatus Amesbacteria bacterium GW2011_GWA1_44_24]KKU32153.1 MAG: hypothetical protein UX46_C0001G0140 [Candidatus Amesbacteria bacterium GW2011_GWC1_46_24]KKU67837.1 MAG: hypothetical protein UX91_C0001G0141 [Candidatus Amesbacteria bacterium GW2011_GWB1_47_19]OGD05001.1 MAG: hypothetical protein A2379_03790 [Candidatus Amesbacteria bacterium RIFOXYB1_FULL_47_13]HBC72435.1 hypothetical protein [Candidatus Amesbacteria bacterium]